MKLLELLVSVFSFLKEGVVAMQSRISKLPSWVQKMNWKKAASASFVFFFAKGMLWVAAAAWVALTV
ncbi:hypothetical protein Q4490_04715 [Neptunomonas phycophila]|uniref:Uncharacterized protein n=2 Tax=Neptunomonas phycophila TaxID=1572645 RepID=A0AAW7XIF0_9GAMM|nr:hypothetical protein [Neptunomonas phycophila]MDO6452859.1 hypothetical protein [Neptunomonas phycophila]